MVKARSNFWILTNSHPHTGKLRSNYVKNDNTQNIVRTHKNRKRVCYSPL